jgi:hypothetical protein
MLWIARNLHDQAWDITNRLVAAMRKGGLVIGLSNLPEVVQEYESGAVLWRDVYASLLHLLARHEVEVVMGGLSPVLATRFRARLRDEFSDESWDDPEVWEGTAVWIDSACGEHRDRRQIVPRIREWIRRNPASG